MSLKANVFAYMLASSILKTTEKATIAGTVISENLIFDGGVVLPDYVKVYETQKVCNPLFPLELSSSKATRFFNTTSCLIGAVRLAEDVMIQDVNDTNNLAYAIGIKREDKTDFESTIADISTGMIFTDLENSGGGAVNALCGGQGIIDAFRNNTTNDHESTFQSPGGDVALKLEHNDASTDTAEINGYEVVLVQRGFMPGVGSYKRELDPEGNIIRIECSIYSNPGVGGVRTVSLPVSIPVADESKISVGAIGIAATPGGAFAVFQPGTLTTTTFDIDIFDLAAWGSALPVYLNFVWTA